MSKFKFKDLTDEIILRFKLEYDNRLDNNLTVERLAIKLGNEFNLSERTVRKWFKKLGFKHFQINLNSNTFLCAFIWIQMQSHCF